MKSEITVKVVRKGGQILINETLEATQAELVKLHAEEENDLNVIGEAVRRVYEESKASSMNMDALVSFTFSKLSGVDASSFGMVADRVKTYVRSSPDLFFISKGRGKNGTTGGGVKYLPRLTVEELAEVTEARKRAAEKAATKAA